MLSSLIHPSFEKNNILFGYLEEQWQPMVWLGWKCGKSEVRSWERPADILLGAGGGSLSELADEVKMASSVWRPSMLFSHQWQLSVHHLSPLSLPPAPLFLSFSFFRLEFTLFIPSFLKRSRAKGTDGWRIYEIGNLLLNRWGAVGPENLRTVAKSQVFVSVAQSL